MKPVLIIGASGFGRLVRVLVEEVGRQFAGFVDDQAQGEQVVGGTRDLGGHLGAAEYDLALAVGYNHLRARLNLYLAMKELGFFFPVLVHPSARVSSHSILAEGCIVMSGVDIDAFCSAGPICVMWPNSTISHDVDVGANTFVSPAATICGHVHVGSSCFIGAGATIVNEVTVPDEAFVRAGTLFSRKDAVRGAD